MYQYYKIAPLQLKKTHHLILRILRFGNWYHKLNSLIVINYYISHKFHSVIVTEKNRWVWFSYKRDETFLCAYGYHFVCKIWYKWNNSRHQLQLWATLTSCANWNVNICYVFDWNSWRNLCYWARFFISKYTKFKISTTSHTLSTER